MVLAALTLALFLAGLQRAYKNLRGELEPDDDGQQLRRRVLAILRKGLSAASSAAS